MTRPTRPIPSNEDRSSANRRKTRHHTFHKRGPAGSKLLKGFYKAHHGVKAKATKDDAGNVTTALQEARTWYANFNPGKRP